MIFTHLRAALQGQVEEEIRRGGKPVAVRLIDNTRDGIASAEASAPHALELPRIEGLDAHADPAVARRHREQRFEGASEQRPE